VEILFCGVRGSTSAPGADFVRVGGHTSCVALTRSGEDTPSLVLDAGTGLQRLTDRLGGAPFRGTLLLTHLHWDHSQGLPFFRSGDQPGSRVHLLLPDQQDGRAAVDVLAGSMSPPHFPIRPEGLQGAWTFATLEEGEHVIEEFEVTAVELPHKGGRTFGYRVVDPSGASVVYASDHGPITMGPGEDGHGPVHDAILDLARGADVLIHDAQFTAPELAIAELYGHATVDYCYRLAEQAEARKLVLFHHGPARTDDQLDAIAGDVAARIPVVVAVEGQQIDVGGNPR
jgi:phosphoribosyl 1,2-cyclic phosphodiesterase